jgi:NAD-dependent dihydropyrimidine dehydrogenase PreA subunit
MKLRYIDNIASLEYDTDKCNGCKMCVEVCPRAVFVMEGKKAKVADKNACIECGACMVNCATGAFNVDTGPGCAAAVISSLLSGGRNI